MSCYEDTSTIQRMLLDMQKYVDHNIGIRNVTGLTFYGKDYATLTFTVKGGDEITFSISRKKKEEEQCDT